MCTFCICHLHHVCRWTLHFLQIDVTILYSVSIYLYVDCAGLSKKVDGSINQSIHTIALRVVIIFFKPRYISKLSYASCTRAA